VTDRLYFTDSYLSAFDATVASEADGGTRVYFNRTAFYPTSGGQPNDLGTCGGVPVLDVIDEGESIAHVLAEPLHTQTVHCEIDWSRRYDHMQQHTGQHLLSAVFSDVFGFETLSFHLGPDVSSIELGTPELSDARIDRAMQRATVLISQAIPVHAGFEAADEVRGLRKQSSRSGLLRVIEIQNVDRSACGGTHVRSTSEIGPILVRRQEKIRGNTRIEFVCGLRGLRTATADFRLLREMAQQAGVPLSNLPATLQSLSERLKEARKERAGLSLELARRNGAGRWETINPSGDGLRRLVLPADAIDEESRIFAKAFVERGEAAVVLFCPQPPSLLFAASAGSGINAGAALKSAIGKYGGRGGGSEQIAQGTVPNQSDLHLALRDLGFAVPAGGTA
jgi:alanyl-tRNA synthetase